MVAKTPITVTLPLKHILYGILYQLKHIYILQRLFS